MVLRKGKKFNTRTGKTLRYHPKDPGCGGASGFCGQNVIVKSRNFDCTQSHVKHFAESIDDGALETTINANNRADTVMYSMNKRKRWLLPEMLAENISDVDIHQDLEYKVVMVERNLTDTLKTKMLADCKAVHNSQFAGSKCRRAKNAYSFESDLEERGAVRNRREELAHRRRERARTGVRLEVPKKRPRDETGEAPRPELRYEVIGPRPANQYPWHMEKREPKEHTLYSLDRMVPFENHHHKTPTYNEDLDWQLDFEDLEEDLILPSLDDSDCREYIKDDEDKMCLGAFLHLDRLSNRSQNRRLRRKLCEVDDYCESYAEPKSDRSAKHSSRQKYGKGCAIYTPWAEPSLDQAVTAKSALSDTDTLDSGFESDHSTSSLLEDFGRSWLDLGTIQSNCVRPEELEKNFGACYVEGCSVPRRFTIRMKVNNSQVPVSVFALFTAKNVHSSDDTIDLRMRLCSGDFSAAELCGWMSETVNLQNISDPITNLVDQLQRVLSSKYSVSKITSTKVSHQKRPNVKLDIVKELMGWRFDYMTIEEVKGHLDNEVAALSKDRLTSEKCRVPEFLQEESCGICFESLSPSVDGAETGLALVPCGHWFCEGCWVQHVACRVRSNEATICCPAYKCQSEIDGPTLLSLLPDSLTRPYLSRRHDDRISTHREWRWCPNPTCGRLVRVGRGKEERGLGPAQLGVPVPCECGQSWCSECFEASHWPATCKQAARHAEHIKNIGLDEHNKQKPIRAVQVKRCGRCRHPIEKNGGCTHMTCRCGFCFCWHCLAAWEDHDFNRWPYRCPQPKEELETVQLSKNKPSKTVLLDLAITNWKQTRPRVIHKNQRAAIALAKWTFLNTTHNPSYDSELVTIAKINKELTVHFLPSYAKDEDHFRLLALLGQASVMASFTAEAHVVLEYLSVLVAMGPRRLRGGNNGWKTFIRRLMFITGRMEYLLENERDRKRKDSWETLCYLLHQGTCCLMEVTRAVCLVHRKLVVKGQRSPKTQQDGGRESN